MLRNSEVHVGHHVVKKYRNTGFRVSDVQFIGMLVPSRNVKLSSGACDPTSLPILSEVDKVAVGFMFPTSSLAASGLAHATNTNAKTEPI